MVSGSLIVPGEAQHVLHVVFASRPAGYPSRGGHGAAGEQAAVAGRMAEGQDLVLGGEHHAVLADEAPKGKAPTVTANVAKQLVAAQAALKADKPDEAIASLKEAQAAKGEKTPYDLFIINEMLGTAYVKQKDYQNAAPLLEAAARSEYCDPAQSKAWLRAVMVIDYNNSPDSWRECKR